MLLIGILIIVVLGIGANGIFGAKNYSGNHGQSRPMASGGEFIAIMILIGLSVWIYTNVINQ